MKIAKKFCVKETQTFVLIFNIPVQSTQGNINTRYELIRNFLRLTSKANKKVFKEMFSLQSLSSIKEFIEMFRMD